METKLNKKYDFVITLQPTSPLLSSVTLDNTIDKIIKNNSIDTILPVVDATHLYWKASGEKIIPDYIERLNRQWLPKRYKETGAFLISKREFITKFSRFGIKISTFTLNEVEGLDIDSPTDWIIAESLIKELKIAFVVDGNKTIGMGHIYRTIALANRFVGRNIAFFTYDSDAKSLQLISNAGYVVIKSTSKYPLKEIKNFNPRIVINDILDTEKKYVLQLKRDGYFVVNFEDLGSGSEEANLTFNALYEKSEPLSSHRFGYRFECINEKFLLHDPISFKSEPLTLLLTFGGIDENNLTYRVLESISSSKLTVIKKIIIIVGSGYSNMDKLNRVIKETGQTVELFQNVDNMPKIMSEADIAITSNGRTVYELAAMGIPTISIAQNDRETLHSFARYHKGVKYLGIAYAYNQSTLIKMLTEILANKRLRKVMYQAQIIDGEKIRKGTKTVIDEISHEYWRFDDERNKDW